MTGETDLVTLLRSMRPVLHPEVYVFATLKPGEEPAPSLAPIMTFRENEGMTLILLESEARTIGLAGTFPSRMITLQVHSSLSAVGFLAAIGTRLAEAGLAVNPVSAYFHDHLFVPAEGAEEALAILQSLAVECS
jgi:uncharacterized protein